MYRCFGLRGLSGMDRSSNPADRSGSRNCLRKCSRSLIAATVCNSSLDFKTEAEAWSIAKTCGALAGYHFHQQTSAALHICYNESNRFLQTYNQSRSTAFCRNFLANFSD